jgi:hypothetical protein
LSSVCHKNVGLNVWEPRISGTSNFPIGCPKGIEVGTEYVEVSVELEQ